MDVIVERCAALDVHKKMVMACVHAPTVAGAAARIAGVPHVLAGFGAAAVSGWRPRG